jgi:PAS domain S-box-containing protein
MDRDQELSGIAAQALGQAADAVAIFTAHEDPVGSEIVFVNHAFAQMTGYRVEDLVGHSALLLMGRRPGLEDVRSSLGAQRSGPHFAVTRRVRSNGTAYDVEVRIAPLVAETGAVTHYVLSQREIKAPGAGVAAEPGEGWSSSLALAEAGLCAVSAAIDDVVIEVREAIVELAMVDDARCDDLTGKLGDALEAAAEARDVVAELRAV